MATYDDVMAVCLNSYNWGVCQSARPGFNGTNQALNEGRTPEAIASDLSRYARSFPSPPPGYEDQTPDGVWAYQLYHCYGAGSHYVETNTNIALGYSSPDAALPSVPRAYLAEQAWEIAMQGWYYTGDTKFLDVDTPEGKAELDARLEFAKILPASWDGVSHDLYKYFVVTGLVLREVPPFGVSQSKLPRDWYGYNVQKYLDNEWAVRKMLPAPWGLGGVPQ